MPRTHHDEDVDAARIAIGAALLEVQNLGARHRAAVLKLEAAYMQLTELTASPPTLALCAECVNQVL